MACVSSGSFAIVLERIERFVGPITKDERPAGVLVNKGDLPTRLVSFPDFPPLESGQECAELIGLPGVGEDQCDIAGRGHSEVAMHRFGGMEKEGGCPRGGQCRRDLSSNMTRLAHAGHDNAPYAGDDALDGLVKGGIKAIRELKECLGLFRENTAAMIPRD